MKKYIYILLVGLSVGQWCDAQPMTAEKIIDGYLENSGGMARWTEVMGIEMQATLTQGDTGIPLEIVRFADGRTYTKFRVSGSDFYSNVFDGTTLWSTNFTTQEPEKADEESFANFKLDLNDFPDAMLFYKRNGYKVEFQGSETIRGVEAYKIKLTKEPRQFNGEIVEDVSYFFFDVNTMLPVAQKSPLPGSLAGDPMSMVVRSDYREVGGLYFPFELLQGMEDGALNAVHIASIVLNPEVNPTIFQFRGGE